MLGAALVPGSMVERVFSHGSLVAVGRRSYALYLVHLPVYWAWQTRSPGLPNWQLLLQGGAASYALAYAMGRVVEDPLRYRRWTMAEAKQSLAVGLTAMVAILGAGTLVHDDTNEGPTVAALDDVLSGASTPTVSAPTTSPDRSAMVDPGPGETTPATVAAASPTTVAAAPTSGADGGAGAAGATIPSVLVVGDSVAGNLAAGLNDVAVGRWTTLDGHVDGCSLIAGTR